MGEEAVSITPATRTDDAAVWQLARETDTDWAYLLWCEDYRRSSVVAIIDGRAAGFALVKPSAKGEPEVVAVEVSPRYRRWGLRDTLLKALGVQPEGWQAGA